MCVVVHGISDSSLSLSFSLFLFCSVTRNYLEWLISLPWSSLPPSPPSLSAAQKILDNGHYAMKDVKSRISEYIAVTVLRKTIQGKILCLVGPPGVGKTRFVCVMCLYVCVCCLVETLLNVHSIKPFPISSLSFSLSLSLSSQHCEEHRGLSPPALFPFFCWRPSRCC